MSCGAETEANTLLTALLVGEDVSLPDIDLSDLVIPDDVLANMAGVITQVTNDALTTTTVDGSGTFDIMMRGFKAHLQQEFEKNRITGADYTKAYIALTQAAMSGAVQFLLQKDQAFWQATTAQLSAYTAQAQFETAKMQLVNAKFDALTSKANYGLTKMKIASESMAYCTAQFQLQQILPQQLMLLNEQTEAQRAQTMDTRSDGTTVAGAMGEQKALYAQQIISYQRNSETTAAKLYTDAWITMKTIDEGLDPPTNFTNANFNAVLNTVQVNNGLSEATVQTTDTTT